MRRALFMVVFPFLGGVVSCGDDVSREDYSTVEQSLKKGAPGAVNGDASYCDDPGNLCGLGEGDCDQHSQCEAGLICGRDNGPKFGFLTGMDVCVPAHCSNNRLDLTHGETGLDCGGGCGSCPTTNPYSDGHLLFCADPNFPCGAGEGHCNPSRSFCEGNLLCGKDIGWRYGKEATSDVCTAPHCLNYKYEPELGETGLDCGGECGSCPTANPYPDGHHLHCSDPNFSCGLGEGKCTDKGFCEAGLVCVHNIGPRYDKPVGEDVCTAAHCINGLLDVEEGEVRLDCGGVCGNCEPVEPMSVATGDDHTCAIVAGDVRCWGSNQFGQIGGVAGLGTATPQTMPVTILRGDVTAIAAGGAHTCAVQGGDLKCWGSNQFGQLGSTTGVGTTSPQTEAVTVLSANVTAVSVGKSHSCAIQGGALKCWGLNRYGQLGGLLGSGTNTPQPTPQTVFSSGVTKVSVGVEHTCAVHNGALKCWGSNKLGQLGVSTSLGLALANVVPLTVLFGNVSDVAAGVSHSCAIQGGALKCWGVNRYGQLGSMVNNGLNLPTILPQTVFASGATSLVVGKSHSCAIQGGALKCWGLNAVGQLGVSNNVGTLSANPSPRTVFASESAGLSGGAEHSCAMHAGTLKCWGLNLSGQLGDVVNSGTSSPNATPREVSEL